jgi:hypothetical protein
MHDDYKVLFLQYLIMLSAISNNTLTGKEMSSFKTFIDHVNGTIATADMDKQPSAPLQKLELPNAERFNGLYVLLEKLKSRGTPINYNEILCKIPKQKKKTGSNTVESIKQDMARMLNKHNEQGGSTLIESVLNEKTLCKLLKRYQVTPPPNQAFIKDIMTTLKLEFLEHLPNKCHVLHSLIQSGTLNETQKKIASKKICLFPKNQQQSLRQLLEQKPAPTPAQTNKFELLRAQIRKEKPTNDEKKKQLCSCISKNRSALTDTQYKCLTSMLSSS